MAENESIKADSDQKPEEIGSQQGRFVTNICETIGYSASLIWIPYILITQSLSITDFPFWVPSSSYFLASLVPKMISLLICTIAGVLLFAFADLFNSKKRYLYVWSFAFMIIVVALFIPSPTIKLILLAISYSTTFLMWKTYLLNKHFGQRSLLCSIFFGACILIASALFDDATASLMPIVLLLVSLCMFLAVSDTAFTNWLFIPKQATKRKGLTSAQRTFPVMVKVLTGVSCGVIIFIQNTVVSLIFFGGAWLIGSILLVLYCKLNIMPSKSAFRGSFTFAAVCFTLSIPLTQGKAQLACAGLLAIALIANDIINVLRHINVVKDSTLSETYLIGYRLLTSSLGIALGFLSSSVILYHFGPSSSATFGFFSFLACTTLFFCLLSMGVFEKKYTRLPTTNAVDPWHEKVLIVANKYELTPRQIEIFDCLSRGRNAKYIEGRLYLSEGTVKKQAFLIYKKLGIHNQQDLITAVLNVELGTELQRTKNSQELSSST